jgi:hypothetical protein
LKKKNYTLIPGELDKKFTQAEKDQYNSDASLQDLKSGIGAHLANVAGTTAATLGSSITSLPLAAWGGAGGGMIARGIGQDVSLAETDPSALIPGIGYIPGAEKLVREHPYAAGALTGGLSMAALPAAVYYTGKKYYPYSTSHTFNNIKNVGKSLSKLTEFMEKDKSLLEKIKLRAKGLPIALTLPAIGLGIAGLSGLAYYGANKAKQKFNEATQSYDENS